MKIESSTLQMSATHSASYSAVTKSTAVEMYLPAESDTPPGEKETSGAISLSLDDQAGLLGTSQSSQPFSISSRHTLSSLEASAELNNKLLKHIIEMMYDMIQGKNLKVYSNKADYLTDSGASVYTTQTWYRSEETTTTFSEKEAATFATKGTVKTSDGRELPFSLSLSLSRSFLQQTSTSITESTQVIRRLHDPLVINMDILSASITEQKFLFDIDSDGVQEKISSLGKGSGFLALDKNGDGIINDGSELFGTQSGDGFADLASYDVDGNGWIDENDSIFSKLKVWTKDSEGNDKLLSLKDADIGAIFLGNVATGFSLNDAQTNDINARIQSTGIYLHESTGEAGTIQHVDFAV